MLNTFNNLLIGHCILGLAMVTLHSIHDAAEAHAASKLQVLRIVQIGLAQPPVIQVGHLLLLIIFRSLAFSKLLNIFRKQYTLLIFESKLFLKILLHVLSIFILYNIMYFI